MTNNENLLEPGVLSVRGLQAGFPIKEGLFRRARGFIQAVDDVTLEIQPGSTLALVGESGCGKTTVGRAILRLVDTQDGEVWFGGQNLTQLSRAQLRPYRRQIQIVFQDPLSSLNPRMRIRDIVAEGLNTFGIGASEDERSQLVKSILARVQLDPAHMWRYPHEFSGGQRQRIGIARALVVEPRVLICDESVSALDVSVQAQILNLLKSLQSDMGLSYLFITHDLSVVRYLADTIAVMYLGQIVEQGPASKIFHSPQHPYTQALLAAIPSVDPKNRSGRAPVLGDVPSPINPPNGCRFHTRCPKVFDRCRYQPPELYSSADSGCRCLLIEPSCE